MKIGGQHQSAEADRTRRGNAAEGPGRSGGSGTSRVAASTDRVETSADLKLAAAAMQAVLGTPDVRPDAIARGRQALENGTLGADANRLADSILTALLEQ